MDKGSPFSASLLYREAIMSITGLIDPFQALSNTLFFAAASLTSAIELHVDVRWASDVGVHFPSFVV